MSVASDRTLKTPRATAWPGRALRCGLGELRAAWDDAVRRLHAGGGAALTIEAGERYWVLRRKQRPIGQIDREYSDQDECRHLLTESVVAAGSPAILVEIPPERVLSKIVSRSEEHTSELQ